MSKIEQPPEPRDEWPSPPEPPPVVYRFGSIELRIEGARYAPCPRCGILKPFNDGCTFCKT